MKKLIISGPMNGADMAIIRDMARDKYTDGTKGLSVLNLKNARMCSGGGVIGEYSNSYFVWDSDYGDDMRYIYTKDDVISEGLFSYLWSLSEIVLPDSITKIEHHAFKGCGYLERVTIGDAVKEIGDCAFLYCERLTDMVIPDSVQFIGQEAFCGCEELESITFPLGIKTVENYLCRGCKTLKTIELPDGVESINRSAFSSCESLETVKLPKSLKSVGRSAFAYCSALTKVQISDLASWCVIDFPDSTANPTCYAKSLFLGSGSYAISNLEIPDGIESIGSYAFINCQNLSVVNFPASIKEVKKGAFKGCTAINKVCIPDIATWCGIKFNSDIVYETIDIRIEDRYGDGYWYNPEMKKIQYTSNPLFYSNALYIGNQKVVELDIPEGVASVREGAFVNCLSLKSVSLPSTLNTVEGMAFSGCGNITSVKTSGKTSWNNMNFKSVKVMYDIKCGSPSSELWIDYEDYEELYKDDYCSNPVYATCMAKLSSSASPKWSSTNADVATVSGSCSITAKSAGSAMILAETADYRNYCDFIVGEEPILIDTLRFNNAQMELPVGSTIESEVTIIPSDATNKTLFWSSSDTTVVIVSEDGTVTAIAAGTATITATTTDGTDLSDTYIVTVSNAVEDDSNPADFENVVYIEKTTGYSGSQLKYSLKMKNAVETVGFQVDIYA